MAGEIGFSDAALSQLEKEMLRTAESVYPAEVKKFLRKEGNEGRKILRAEIRATTTKRTGALLKGIKRGKVWKNGDSWQVRIYNAAGHASPVSLGHKKVLWGKRTNDFVKGKHFFNTADKKFESKVVQDASKFLDDLLERGFNV